MQEITALLGLLLGSPRDESEVLPFLTELFSDAEMIKLPAQRWLGPFIAKRRAPKAIKRYQKIGGASPLMKISRHQMEAVAEELERRGWPVIPHVVARYLGPRARDVLAQLRREGVTQILALPLYPQRSTSTSGSALSDLEAARLENDPEILSPEPWCTHPSYIRALAETVYEGLRGFESKPHLLLAAHSLPQKLVDAGDPYPGEILKTGRALLNALSWEGSSSHAYQSRVGPIAWLGPDTGDELRRLAAEGIEDLLVVPISFVSDHLETLYDLDYELAEEAKAAGIKRYARCPALNTNPTFISALADLAQGCLEQKR